MLPQTIDLVIFTEICSLYSAHLHLRWKMNRKQPKLPFYVAKFGSLNVFWISHIDKTRFHHTHFFMVYSSLANTNYPETQFWFWTNTGLSCFLAKQVPCFRSLECKWKICGMQRKHFQLQPIKYQREKKPIQWWSAIDSWPGICFICRPSTNHPLCAHFLDQTFNIILLDCWLNHALQ